MIFRRFSPSRDAEAPCRILFVEACEDGTVGGSHQALYDLVRMLDRRRYEPVVLFYEPNRWVGPIRALGVEVITFEEERRREKAPHLTRDFAGRIHSVLGAPFLRAALMRRLAIDLVHLNNSPAEGCEDWLPAARLAGVPCVAHATGPFRPPRDVVRRWATRRYDRVIAISGFVEETLTSQGMPAERIVRIAPGVDIAGFRARVRRPPAEVRRELGVADDVLLALMVGNVRPWKGQDVVLSALASLPREQCARLHVAFAGAVSAENAEYHASLEATVRESGLARQVSFLGSRADVPDLMSAADVVVHASRIPEPFGIVVVEGLALGKPVLATHCGGPAEVLTPECGRLYDPADPAQLAALLATLIEDPSLRGTLGAGALSRAARYDVADTNRAIEGVYEALLESRRASMRRKPARNVLPILSQL